MSDQVTIPRELFNALCEAAIFQEGELVGYANIPHERWRNRYEQAKKVALQAVAIRDALDKPQQIG